MFFSTDRIDCIESKLGDLDYRLQRIESDIRIIYMVMDGYSETIESTGQICELRPLLEEVMGILSVKKGVSNGC